MHSFTEAPDQKFFLLILWVDRVDLYLFNVKKCILDLHTELLDAYTCLGTAPFVFYALSTWSTFLQNASLLFISGKKRGPLRFYRK